MGARVQPNPGFGGGVSGSFGVAQLYLPGKTSATRVHYQNVAGIAITEGDIVLGPVDQLQATYGAPRFANASHATATNNTSHLWPGAVIPYEIDPNVTEPRRGWVNWAVAHVSSESVVKLRPRTPADKNYVRFVELAVDACTSHVGRIGGSQDINVTGCGSGGNVVHEIGHASGFYHEQQRTDRDQYITIAWDEIAPEHREWFAIETNANDIGQYDYSSVMHYGRTAFSATGRDTIIPKDPNARIGNRDGLSPLDKAALAQLYSTASIPFEIPGLGGLPGGGSLPGSLPLPFPIPSSVPGLPSSLPPGWPQVPALPPGTPALPPIPGLTQ